MLRSPLLTLISGQRRRVAENPDGFSESRTFRAAAAMLSTRNLLHVDGVWAIPVGYRQRSSTRDHKLFFALVISSKRHTLPERPYSVINSFVSDGASADVLLLYDLTVTRANYTSYTMEYTHTEFIAPSEKIQSFLTRFISSYTATRMANKDALDEWPRHSAGTRWGSRPPTASPGRNARCGAGRDSAQKSPHRATDTDDRLRVSRIFCGRA
ncbi:hypothetical protein MRX96_058473 [Rhipicephalus microplus]